MRSVRSAALSVAVIILLAVAIPLFPSLANKVNAAGDVIEVGTVESIKEALNDASNSNKTIKLTASIEADEVINVRYPITLDLNGYTIGFAAHAGYLSIELADADEIVTITGDGHIRGEWLGGGVLYSNRGKVIFESGTVENRDITDGKALNSKDRKCFTVYQGKFIARAEWSDDIVDSSFAYHVSIFDSDTGFTTTKYHGLRIAGKVADPSKNQDILGDGVFSYDPETKTLSVNGVLDYDRESIALASLIPDLIIDIQGPSSVTGLLDLYNGTTITGNNKLTVINDTFEASIEADDLLIKDVAIELKGTSGGICSYEGEFTIENSLIIDNSDGISIKSEDETLKLKDCKVIEPENAVVKSDAIYMENGTDIATNVVIQPENDNMWGPVEYIWSEDYSTCTAKRACIPDPAIIETETVTTTSAVKIPATYSDKGTTTYTATFSKAVFGTKTIDVQDIPVKDPSFEDFVERLYVVALGRASEPEGKAFWVDQVVNKGLTGADCARFFMLGAPEFLGRNLTDDEFVEVLYKTYFDRDSEPDGKAYWMGRLASGEDRAVLVEEFIESVEWCNVCAMYGVKSGAKWHKATIASTNAIKFATRLYTCCLSRDPEADGLNYWSLALTNLEVSGYQAASLFFESPEFQGFNTTNEEYIKRLYTTFMGREADADGFNYWLGLLNNGTSRTDAMKAFASCPEFQEICNQYGIDRGEI